MDQIKKLLFSFRSRSIEPLALSHTNQVATFSAFQQSILREETRAMEASLRLQGARTLSTLQASAATAFDRSIRTSESPVRLHTRGSLSESSFCGKNEVSMRAFGRQRAPSARRRVVRVMAKVLEETVTREDKQTLEKGQLE